MPSAESTIYAQLEAHGLHWDERPRRQSEHRREYEQAIELIKSKDILYYCSCTREEIRRNATTGQHESIYAGTCRNAGLGAQDNAIRIKVPDTEIVINDPLHGQIRGHMGTAIGDFVLKRKDAVIGYQLASTVDESAMQITEVVRGADLTSSSLRQKFLAGQLELAAPDYLHLPLVRGPDGRKLSKQNHAEPLNSVQASANLISALRFLGQDTEEFEGLRPAQILSLAAQRWDISLIPNHSN